MKITYSILALLFIAILWTATQLPEISNDDHTITSLPWIIKTDSQGGSSVFGLNIEEASVRQAQAVFNDEAEFGIFIDNDGSQSLEAFFNYTQIAGLQARAAEARDFASEWRLRLTQLAYDRDATVTEVSADIPHETRGVLSALLHVVGAVHGLLRDPVRSGTEALDRVDELRVELAGIEVGDTVGFEDFKGLGDDAHRVPFRGVVQRVFKNGRVKIHRAFYRDASGRFNQVATAGYGRVTAFTKSLADVRRVS